jgi:hypothetical protein
MGGLVSGITDAVGGAVDAVGDLGGSIDQTVRGAVPGGWASVAAMAAGVPPGQAMQMGGLANNFLGGGGGSGLASGLTAGGGGYYGGGSPIVINTAAPQQQPSLFSQLLPFLAQAGGGLAQQQVNKEAAQAQADALRKAGLEAQQASQFRPVGTTTRFGSSNFQVDPTTGRLISAGYTATPLAQGYQDKLAGMTSQGLMQGQQLQGLASQYLGESPEAVRQRYVQQQTALLAPQQEQALAGIRNNLFQTGRSGLATGATSAGGLAATNPEMAAYYNSLANQQRQIAAGADQAAQQQIQFGQQLAGQAYQPFTSGFAAQGAVESAAQQPMKMSTDLASQFQQANQAGAEYNLKAQNAAANAMLRANQVSPFADIMTALGKTPEATTALGGAVGGLLGGLFGGTPAAQASTNPYGFDASALNFGGWSDLGGGSGGTGFDWGDLGSVDQWWL